MPFLNDVAGNVAVKSYNSNSQYYQLQSLPNWDFIEIQCIDYKNSWNLSVSSSPFPLEHMHRQENNITTNNQKNTLKDLNRQVRSSSHNQVQVSQMLQAQHRNQNRKTTVCYTPWKQNNTRRIWNYRWAVTVSTVELLIPLLKAMRFPRYASTRTLKNK